MESSGMNVVDQYVSLKHVEEHLIRFIGKQDMKEAGKYSVIGKGTRFCMMIVVL
jgi:hypothetical protein